MTILELDDFLPSIADHDDKQCPLKNCIRNNYRHIRKWAKRTNTNCFRIYDRDIKEFPLAIDFYAGKFCIHYFTFTRETDEPKEEHREAAEKALFDLFGAEESNLYWRTRIKRKKTEQYEKAGRSNDFFQVLEYGIKFWVNLEDYLDTGLFLDHRETRRAVAAISKGKRVLNLFAYTSSFSVHAAMSGALSTKSVDMSNTYAAWGEDNFSLNSLSLDNNIVVRADCMKFLEQERGIYDIIIIDPPTLSRSKKMDEMFDVQKDYPFLIRKALGLLAKDGVIFFSTNYRKFDFDRKLIPPCEILDISKKTLPIDFRDPKIRECWKISHPRK
ncbi:MAG: class I SAM-dependent methyltransferase [Parachlamydiales bacterium]|nr:class I SAM-dependent methyltransferase [Parachlamydiales bacterium]